MFWVRMLFLAGVGELGLRVKDSGLGVGGRLMQRT